MHHYNPFIHTSFYSQTPQVSQEKKGFVPASFFSPLFTPQEQRLKLSLEKKVKNRVLRKEMSELLCVSPKAHADDMSKVVPDLWESSTRAIVSYDCRSYSVKGAGFEKISRP